jgi:ABC-type multidrug transport system ATPase subunit
MILTTHYMEEAEQLCDQIIIIDHGTVLRQGSLRELLDGSTTDAPDGPRPRNLDELFISLTGRRLDE